MPGSMIYGQNGRRPVCRGARRRRRHGHAGRRHPPQQPRRKDVRLPCWLGGGGGLRGCRHRRMRNRVRSFGRGARRRLQDHPVGLPPGRCLPRPLLYRLGRRENERSPAISSLTGRVDWRWGEQWRRSMMCGMRRWRTCRYSPGGGSARWSAGRTSHLPGGGGGV